MRFTVASSCRAANITGSLQVGTHL